MILAIKHKRFFLFLFIGITLFFGYQLKNLSFEHNLEKFFNTDNNEYRFSQEYFQQFGDNNNKQGGYQERVILILKSNHKINFSFLTQLDNLDHKINNISSVGKTYNIINQPLFVFTSMGRYPYKLFHLNDSLSFSEDLKIAENYIDITSKYISKDWKSALIYINLKEGANLDTILSLKKQITTLPEITPFNKVEFFNSQLTNHLVVKKLQTESLILTGIAIALILLILIYFTRSLRGVLIPLSIVLMSVIWIMGTITLTGVSLNVLTIAIPVIVGVISLSDVVHIISRFSEEEGDDDFNKMKHTQKDMLKAIILTSLTTGIGFLSLIPSNIQVFVEFGFFATLGVVYAFILAYWFLPILLVGNHKITLNSNLQKVTPKRIYAKTTSIALAILIILCIVGLILVKNDSYIYDDLHAKDEASKTIKTIEKDFYGIRDLSLAVILKDKTKKLTDFEVLTQLNELESAVDSIYNMKNNTSLVSLIKQMHRARNGGRKDYFTIPDNQDELNKIWRLFEKNHQYFTVNALVSENKLNTFIYSKTHDGGSYNTKINNEKLNYLVSNRFSSYFEVIPTGGSHVMDQTNFAVTSTMLYSLAGIMLLIVALMCWVFKSVKLGLISMLPNILPLIVIIGVVGWLNMGLSISTTIVFTIVFGIAVDDTIHFLSRFQIESKKHISLEEKINNCLKTSGGAISLTSIILIAGFGTLIFSDFKANYSTGLLVAIGLLVALLADLFVLPLLLKLFLKNNSLTNP